MYGIYNDILDINQRKIGLEYLENMSLEELFDNLLKDTGKFEKRIENDPMLKYTALGMESAYINDRSILTRAWIRFKMAFKIDQDVAMVEYANELRNLDPSKINPMKSEVLMSRDNFEAYDKLMNIMAGLESDKLNNEVKNLLKSVGKDLDGVVRKLILAMIVIGIPVVNIVVCLWLILEERRLVNNSSDTNHLYGDKIMKYLTSSLVNSGVTKDLGIKVNSDGLLDTTDIGKISTYINKLKVEMLPTKVKNSIKPNFLKDKQPISYEDKKYICDTVLKNVDKYLVTLGSSPTSRANSIKFILSADKFANNYQYGMSFDNIYSLDNMYSSLAMTMILAFIDVNVTTMMLVQDFRRY